MLLTFTMKPEKATRLWALAGKLRESPISEHKKPTHANYKYAIRFICKNEQTLRADSMALNLVGNDTKTFWKGVKCINNWNLQMSRYDHMIGNQTRSRTCGFDRNRTSGLG